MKTFATFLIGAILFSPFAYAGKLTGNPNSMALFVTELVDPAGNPTVTMKAGPLIFDGQNYGVSRLAHTRYDAAGFVGKIIPFQPHNVVMVAPAPTTFTWGGSGGTPDNSVQTVCNGVALPPMQTEVQAQASAYLQQNSYQVSGPMAAYMRKQGIAFGVFRYAQTVQVAVDQQAAVYANPDYAPGDGTSPGNDLCGGCGQGGSASLERPLQDPRHRIFVAALSLAQVGGLSGLSGVNTVDPYLCDPSRIQMQSRTVYWTMTTDETGRETYPQANIKAQSGNLIHATYYSLAVRDLPSTFAYPQGGQITSQQIDANFTPVTAPAAYNVNGAYDAVNNSQAAVDTAAACAANNRLQTCPTTLAGLPDVRYFMDQAGISNAVFDYVQSVSPVYVTIGETTLAGAPTQVQVPSWALYEQARSLTYPECGYATYNNQGYYQVNLNATIARYFVSPTAAVAPVNQMVSTAQTGPTAFNWSVQLEPAVANATAASQVLDPRDGQALISISDVSSGLQQLGTLQTLGQVPLSSYYAYGNLQICDAANHQRISATCPSGYTLALNTSSQPYSYSCTAPAGANHSCPDGSLSASSTCSAQATVTASPWQ